MSNNVLSSYYAEYYTMSVWHCEGAAWIERVRKSYVKIKTGDGNQNLRLLLFRLSI